MDSQPSAVPGANQNQRPIQSAASALVPASEIISEQNNLNELQFSASAKREQFTARTLPEFSREEVYERMQQQGFPELALLWKAHLLTLGAQQTRAGNEEIASAISAHTRPLFGMPRAMCAGLAATGLALGFTYVALNPQLGAHGAGLPLTIWLGGNLTVLGALVVCGLQRYIAAPLMRTMSDAAGEMLRCRDFRTSIEESDRFQNFRKSSEALAIGESWDNRNYAQCYAREQREWKAVEVESGEKQIHRLLQRFLGYKEQASRTYVPGDLTPHLADGKKSVTRFFNQHKSELSESKEGRLPIELGISLLRALASTEVQQGSNGYKHLTREIDRLASGKLIPADIVEGHVWHRDPWRDLTHQEEFYSSASLRGVKKMGRDSKGRLGTFGYHYNPAISALDFSIDNERVVRARCGLSLATTPQGNRVPALFVDGVEGSNALPPEVVLKGLHDYAVGCGVDVLCVNAFSHNVTPQKFARHVKESGARLCKVPIEYLDSSTREYLDAFGMPIQPFEYAYPRGQTLSYVVPLKTTGENLFMAPTIADLALGVLRRNCVWVYFGQAMAGAAYLIGSATPSLLIPLGLLGAAGAAYQNYFQRRSQVT